MDLEKLKAPFPENIISWRVGATDLKKQQREHGPNAKATKGIALAYIDARDVMERLDEVVGIERYQVLHPHANGKTSCRIGIKVGDEWIWKENGAGDSKEEAEKGAFSDSFKRAAVLWGIGRYLYDVPNIWVELDDWGKIKNPNDPRLKKALKDAASGIRGSNEPEPELKPFSDEEGNLLIGRIRQSKSMDELNSEINNAKAAKPRMNDHQYKAIKAEIDKKLAFLSRAPLENAA